MATKISELTATSATDGTETVPVVQGGITKKGTLSTLFSPAGGAAMIGNTPAGTISATTVQAALNEIITDMAAAAGAINVGNTPAGNIAATTVQAALNELDTEKLSIGGNAATATTATTATTAGIPQNSQSAAYTTVLADANKHILHPSADTTARIFTIDSNANVAYVIGTTLTFVNQISAGVVTIAITSDTLSWYPAGSTGSRTLAASGMATAIKITSTAWVITGVGLA